MITFNGCSQACSCSWDYFAKSIVTENKEICACWDITKRHFEIINDKTQYRHILVRVYCGAEGCTQHFEESTKALTKKFLDFYEL
jgi:uncharacterized Fe-S cluster-containing radical SAM superfamily protein